MPERIPRPETENPGLSLNFAIVIFGSLTSPYTAFSFLGLSILSVRRLMRFNKQICYHSLVSGKKKGKRVEWPVFDSIRKPTAPPSRKFGGETPEEKLRPSLRKIKHKKSPDTEA